MSIVARKEREKLARRKTILAAAKELFFENGYQMTTMEEIAEKAELSKRAIYLYFKNKDDLYISVTIEGFVILEEELIRIRDKELSAEEMVRALYYAFINHSLRHKEYFLIYEYFFTDQARENIPEELTDTIYEHTWRCLNLGIEAAREAVEKGVFRKDLDTEKFGILIWRTGSGILHLAVLKNLPEEEERAYMELFEENIDLLIRGARK